MSKKFQVIVADCPWSFSDSLKMSAVKRGAKSNYSTMTMSQIRELPIKNICDPSGAVLCLWVPSSLLQEGLDVMKAWGFKQKQTYIWVKTKKDAWHDMTRICINLIRAGQEIKTKKSLKIAISKCMNEVEWSSILAFFMGRLFRQTHEICLIGTCGKIHSQLANKSQRSVCFAQNLKHSSKPEDLQDSLDLMFPNARKLELFARRIRSGWTCLGNEVCNGEDISISLSKL